MQTDENSKKKNQNETLEIKTLRQMKKAFVRLTSRLDTTKK